MLDGVLNRVQELERIVRDVNSRPLDVSKISGRGELADRFGQAAKELNGLKNSFINSERAVEAFGTTSSRTIANTTALSVAFRRVAENSDVSTNQFREFTVAAQQAAVAANALGKERLSVLAQELSNKGEAGKTIGGGGLVQELLAQEQAVPRSIAALEAYQQELQDMQRLVLNTSKEFALLEQAIKRVDVAMAAPKTRKPRGGGGPFPSDQPFSPAELFKQKTTRSLAPLQKPGTLDAILGAGFPMLFGGGPGAVLGGGLGGALGGMLGGNAGMALSVGLSAVGQKLDEIFGSAMRATQELGAALSSLSMEKLRDTAITVTAELETQVQALIEAGSYEEARQAINKEVTLQTGAIGTSTEDSANAVNLLVNAWDNVLKPIQSILSIIAAPFAAALALILNVVGLIAKGVNVVLSGIGTLIKLGAEFVIKLLGGDEALKSVQESTKAVSEEREKQTAAVEAASKVLFKELMLSRDLNKLEKERTLGRTAAEKDANAQLDLRKQKLQINADYDQRIAEAREKGAGAERDAVERQVAILEGKRSIALKDLEIADSLQKQLRLQEAIKEVESIREKKISLASLEEQIKIRTLELDNKITKQEAERLLTANELLTVQQEISNAQSALSALAPLLTEEDILDIKNKIAKLQLQEVNIKLKLEEQEVERIKQEIARFKDVKVTISINTEKFVTSLKIANEVLQSATGTLNAQFAAQKAINDLLIQRAEQEGDLEKVYALRVKQVELTYRQTVLQIQVEVEQARIKLQQVRLEHQKLALQLQQISLVRKLTNEETDTLLQSKQMLRLMEYQLQLIIKAAGYRIQEAEAIRQMTLEQLAFNRAKEQGNQTGGGGGGSGGSGGKTFNIVPPSGPQLLFASGGYVDKPTSAVIGEGNEGEFVIPESKMAAAMTRYAEGRRGADVIPADGTSGLSEGQPGTGAAFGGGMPRINNQINVTTGPVMQIDGKTYVSQQDMAQSLRSTADNAVRATLKMLQYNTQVRKSIGIA